MNGALLIGLAVMLVSLFVGQQLRSRFQKYSATPLSNGLSGAEIAARMLADHGITNVRVQSVPGELTDHYDPAKRTVNLSQTVYMGRNAAAAAVAAHECGHAVQHATAYNWLMLRSRLVPVVSLASSLVQWVLLGGILLVNVFPGLLLAGIVLFAATTVFSLVTLPVEYDASARALAWMERTGIVQPSEYALSADALKWAARTYVVAAVGSVATLLYYVMIYLGASRRN